MAMRPLACRFLPIGPLVLHVIIVTFAILAGPSFLGILWALDRRADRARKREQVRLEDAETAAEQMRLAA